jgi:hypothetical protein
MMESAGAKKKTVFSPRTVRMLEGDDSPACLMLASVA